MQKLNYVVNTIGDKFVVIEVKTKLVIKPCQTYNDAKRLAKRLNRGGGFDGTTPEFLVQKFPRFA